MLGYLSILQQLLSLGAGRRHSHISGVNLNMKGIGASIFGLAAIFAAVIFLMVGAQGWLAMVITSPYAEPLSWLCVGGLTLVVGGISMVVAKDAKRERGIISLAYTEKPHPPHKPHEHSEYGAKPHHGPHNDAPRSASPFDDSFIKNAAEEFSSKIEEHPLAAVIIAGLAGMAAGKTIER